VTIKCVERAKANLSGTAGELDLMRPKPKSTKESATKARQYWLWVTRPEYYLDELGNDRDDLDPESGIDPESAPDCSGWWTCHKNTKIGDLIHLYRSRLKKDINSRRSMNRDRDFGRFSEDLARNYLYRQTSEG
jgi:hypothetical protein